MRKTSTATRSPSRAGPFVAGADAELAATYVFLVDRHDPAAAAHSSAKNPKHLRLPARQELYDAPGVGGFAWLRALHQFHPHQGAVAGSGGGHSAVLPGLGHDQDLRRRSLADVPFGGRGEEIAVAVARDHIGENDPRQEARLMQALAPPFDGAIGFEVFQHAFKGDLRGTFDIESAGDFPFADFGLRLAARAVALAGDEGEDFVPRRQTFVARSVGCSRASLD